MKFQIKLSIEMDKVAHETLLLRSFYRKFEAGQVPSEYYEVLKEPDIRKRALLKDELFNNFPVQAEAARTEAWCAELGSKGLPPQEVDKRIRKALNGVRDWVLIGGPPCQAYSLVGRSRRQWKEGLDKGDKRVHLYKEYLRIIAAHHPAVFVMENVKGLLSSKVDGEGMFSLIMRDLKDPSSVFPEIQSPNYRIFSLASKPLNIINGNPVYRSDRDYLIKAEKYGVPQKRHRVILLGLRQDVLVPPQVLEPKTSVSLADVISDLPKIRSGINRAFVKSEVINGKKKRYYRNEQDSDRNWKELVDSYRTEIISWNGFAKDYSIEGVRVPRKGVGGEYVKCDTPSGSNPLFEWYNDSNLDGVVNHESRSHLTQDLKRYMFSSMFAKTYNRFPRLQEFAEHSQELIPDHENATSGKFADRFRVQLPDQPGTTVTSHISKDGHYFIHYDPDQCRSLSVREAARIQTFPDNYLFCGARTSQYHQVGNAVPPYLAFQIGNLVCNLLSSSEEKKQ